MKTPVVFDTEIYANYFLLMFRNVETGKTATYELLPGGEFNRESVRSIMYKYTIVSFNGWRFDMPLIMMALHGEPVERIKEACNAIIDEKLNCWDDAFRERFPDAAFSRKDYDHIDLIEVAPGTASLKIYGGRLHSRRMQDLPIEPKVLITDEQRPILREYCGNDLETTIDLFKKLKPQLELRESMSARYGVDLRSKSDAQIAEAVIRGRVQRDTKQWIDPPKVAAATMFKYVKPAFIRFQTPEMQAALDVVTNSHFYISGTGNVEMSDELKAAKIKFGNSVYRMGIGGLHSSEQRQAIVAKDSDFVLVDRDVRSYYPQIILNLSLYPEQMGPTFLDVYRDILRRRLKAKDEGDKVTADAFKIVANGSFGKFGSKWSTLYSPTLLIQTTITGQLCLLMLIEQLSFWPGIEVVSANTDGIVIKCHKDYECDMHAIIKHWEEITQFETEEARYDAIYSRDVNNYVALKTGGGVKLKGVFAEVGLAKNPTNEVCVEAVVARLERGVPVETTIRGCTDIRKFVNIRKVNGGAVKGDEFLGKAVRWYYAIGETGTINYSGSGYTVARSMGAKPLMMLPDSIPEDLDYDWYIKEAHDILADVGFVENV